MVLEIDIIVEKLIAWTAVAVLPRYSVLFERFREWEHLITCVTSERVQSRLMLFEANRASEVPKTVMTIIVSGCSLMLLKSFRRSEYLSTTITSKRVQGVPMLH